MGLLDHVEHFLDDLNKELEKNLDKVDSSISDFLDDFSDAADQAGISEKFEEFRENLTLSKKEKELKKEEEEYKKEFHKRVAEEYGPRAETTFLKELKKKRKRRGREKFDEVVDPDSTFGQIVQTVRRAADREEEKMENRTKAPRNLFYSGTKKETFNLADHLFVRSGFITHHGLYVGGGKVVHFAPVDGEYIVIGIHEVTLEEFAKGREIRCLNSESPMKYSREEAVRRAYSRVGNEDYDFFGNNCESFVRWCRCGDDEDVWKYE